MYQAAVAEVSEGFVLHSDLDGVTGAEGALILAPSNLPIQGLHVGGRLKADNPLCDQIPDL